MEGGGRMGQLAWGGRQLMKERWASMDSRSARARFSSRTFPPDDLWASSAAPAKHGMSIAGVDEDTQCPKSTSHETQSLPGSAAPELSTSDHGC